MDKFSELKAVAATYSVALNAHRGNPTDKGALYAWDGATKVFSRAISNREMEIIIALLSELEAKDKRIAELEGLVETYRVQNDMWCKLAGARLKRVTELEADVDHLRDKLARPVNLPKTNGHWDEKEKAFEDAITLAKREVRLAGFKCVGDE
ncbi:hypothetical protein [Serratia proteamaculans]